MKHLVILMALILTLASCKQKEKTTNDNTKIEKASKAETSKEWVTLFDGSSFDGWRYYGAGEVVEPWKLEDGAMVFYPPKERNGERYDIVTDKSYTNFVLSLEWKISKNGNSGVFWGVHEDEKFKIYETGPEIQVLDNEGHPDAKNGTSHRAGALYDMVSPSKDVTKPIGEWNTYVITVNHETNEGNAVLNGVEVVKFPVHGEVWDAMVAKSKFANWKDFGTYKTGKIGLQDHGDIVSYRNIKIKEL
jgi:hypothetical protein